jgi:hypothetical protein
LGRLVAQPAAAEVPELDAPEPDVDVDGVDAGVVLVEVLSLDDDPVLEEELSLVLGVDAGAVLDDFEPEPRLSVL